MSFSKAVEAVLVEVDSRWEVRGFKAPYSGVFLTEATGSPDR